VVTSTSNSLYTTATSVTINYGTVAGNVTARGINACGNGAVRSLPISFVYRETAEATAGPTVASLFPNPAFEFFTLQLAEPRQDELTLLLTDLTGRKIFERTIPPDQTSALLSVKESTGGLYQFHLINKDTLITTGNIVIIK
jgi:hypothetical protein